MAELKDIELFINDENIDMITAMGFVDYPAIEEEMFYFKDDKRNNYIFAKPIDNEEGIIVSPALIPEKRIYRFNPYTNEEYNVYFTADTVRKLSQTFLINNNQNNITEQHENPTNGIYLIYSWIVENQEDPIITKYGFKNIPNGTWVVSYKIFNEDIKSKIKSGEIKGISIEAWLSERFDSHKIYEDEARLQELVDKIREELINLD